MKIGSWKIALWQQILFALVLGAIVGSILGPEAKSFGYLGVVFLNLIKMVTIPMILFTIIYGMTSMEGSSNLYRISYKAAVIFMTTSTLAVSVGLTVASLLKPGIGVSPNLLKQFHGSSQLPRVQDLSFVETLIHLIPSNVFAAIADGNILQIIVFAFFFGVILQSKRDDCKQLVLVVHQIAITFFKIIQTIMKISPIGVFGYISAMVGVEGISVLVSLGKLVMTIMLGCLFHYCLLGVLLFLVGRLSPFAFYKKILGAQLIAFATSSSKATLVPLMEICETQLGVSRQKSRFILPLSAALNMDGGAIYQASCAVFFAQMMEVDFTVGQYITLFLMCTLASIGGAGIPGGVILFLGMVLHSVGLPIEGVLLIATIDRIADMMTTVINVTSCGCITVIIDRSEKTLNTKIYYSEKPVKIDKKQ
ncbi:MAG: dicarboxylate/amino acid:cation symporter [Candidatus Midichloria sp.]|nr:dicarboxylate/amino acid:cation symporter [Candidatus Midichloria sp.]